MVGHSISGPTDSVIIHIGSRSVGPDPSLGQPVSAFELSPTCVLVLSESTCTPKHIYGSYVDQSVSCVV